LILIWHRMNHSVNRRRQALHQTHHQSRANLSDCKSNKKNRFGSKHRIESKLFFCQNWNALPRSRRTLSDFSRSSMCLFWAATTSVDVLHAAYKSRTSRLTSKNVLPHLNFDSSSSPNSFRPIHTNKETDATATVCYGHRLLPLPAIISRRYYVDSTGYPSESASSLILKWHAYCLVRQSLSGQAPLLVRRLPSRVR